MTNSNKEALNRGIGLWTAIFAVIGSVIGSGVFKKAGPMAAGLHSTSLVMTAWILAGLVTLVGALTNLEVAGLIGEAGGQYAFFRKMYGRLFAFLYGWSAFAVIESATIAGVGYVFAECVNEIYTLPRFGPALEGFGIAGVITPFDNFGTKAVTVSAILILTWVNRRGVVVGGYISNLFSILKLFGITLVIFVGLTLGGHAAGHSEAAATAAASSASFDSPFGLTGAMFAAMLAAFWAYQGWNSVTTLGGEVKNPTRNIPLAIFLGVIGIITVYLAINFVYFYILPVEEVATLAKKQNVIVAVEAVRAVSGPGGAKAMTFLILFSTLGTLHVTIITASRIYYAMGGDGIFFRGAENAHPVYRTPSKSLIIQGVWASLLVITGTFDQLTDRLVFAAFLFYGAGALGVFVLRRTMPDAPRTFKAFGYPYLPAAFIGFCVALVVITIVQRPVDAAFGLGLILAGLPFYFFWNRSSLPEKSK